MYFASEPFGSLNSQKASVSGLAGACYITVTVAREGKLKYANYIHDNLSTVTHSVLFYP